MDEFDGGGDGSSGGEHVVDDEDFLAGIEGIGVDFDGVGSVFEGGGKDEAAGVDPEPAWSTSYLPWILGGLAPSSKAAGES